MEKDPIFILGFYRSGTSFMHQFLTQDHRLGYHTNYQMIFPEVMLTTEKTLSPFLDLLCRTFNIRDEVHRIQLSFRYPGEEDATMTTANNPRGAQWGYFFPRMMMAQFRKYVLFQEVPEPEIEGWKQDYAFLLKKISLANEGRQLILKSPPNTARVKTLLSMYPKAKFIMVHRNPCDVYVSNQRFWEVTNKVYAVGPTKEIDNNQIILDTYSQIMEQYLAEKTLIPEGQLIEVPYQDLMKVPIESMRKIYDTLGLNDFGEIKGKMESYIEGQRSYKRLKHQLPKNEEKTVSERFAPFISHWGYDLPESS
ncbi:MAG: sulfotransferase [Roseivirga sp.]